LVGQTIAANARLFGGVRLSAAGLDREEMLRIDPNWTFIPQSSD
jgi:hypothetical protein